MKAEDKIDVEKTKIFVTEQEQILSNKYSLIPPQFYNCPQSRVIFYCPFNHTFTKYEKYEIKEILTILNSYQKDDFFIIQIDNDNILYEELLKMQFKSEFENIDKLFDLKLDYCFSPIDELLCFNLSVLTNIDCDEIQKYLIQIFFSDNGVYLINKDCCDNILSIFMKKFNFIETSKQDFFQQARIVKKEGNLINNMSLAEKTRRSFKMKSSNHIPRSIAESKDKDVSNFNNIQTDYFQNENNLSPFQPSRIKDKIEEEDSPLDYIAPKDIQVHITSNFSTDDLIYYLLTFSLGKLEEFAESLIKEVESLKGIYLELSEKERKDFFRRIHNMEISLQLIYQETIIKKKFLQYSKAQFRVYNKLSHNFYFKNYFNFFIELIISKVTQLEIVFEKLENTIKMIKENYSIIIEDNTEKQNVKLNRVMKVLAIITTVYAPMNIIPNLFGMNVLVPWQKTESLWPFFGILMTCISLVIVELFIFKKLKWLED